MPTELDRRSFLQISATAAGGLCVAVLMPASAVAAPRRRKSNERIAPSAQIGAFIEIDESGVVTISAKNPEIGTGTRTALPMIVAEELDVAWERVRVVQAPLDRKYGGQFTGGSTGVSSNWMPMRRAGATARYALVSAAATRWGVDRGECRTENGSVIHGPTNRRLAYGALAADAATVTAPADVPLKSADGFRLLGTRVGNVDTRAIASGTQRFGIDVTRPGMLIASILHAPFGATAASVNETKALAVPGVRRVVRIAPRDNPTRLREGVAVLADNTWAAFEGRRALEVTWNDAAGVEATTSSLTTAFRAAFDRPGERIRDDGDVDAAIRSAARALDVVYEIPFIAHVPMEPVNFAADVRSDRVELWGPTQDPGDAQALVAEVTGVPRANVTLHMERCGGGFGRRLMVDYAAEAAFLSKAVGAPVKVVRTREDDLQHDYYRPAGMHRVQAAVDARGAPVAWAQHLANTSRYAFAQRPDPVKSELYPDDFPARCLPNVRFEYTGVASVIPVGAWRATLHSANAFVVQCAVDELAHLAAADPVAFRLAMLGEPRQLAYADHGGPVFDTGRLAAVIRLAAERAGWGTPLPRGRGRGIAAHFTFGSYAAHVAEVSVDVSGRVRVHRIVAAVDCGTIVNRSGAEAQVQGGVIDGVSSALYGQVTVDRGRVRQSNFTDYRLLRMSESPTIEVHFVQSSTPPSGLGEPPVSPVAPAVANAMFAVTGKRIRRLPING
ncbi:MAG TPA: molybdopterin cofactor-binding domain-containing protein [Gemmatimonadaceae bacterium]|nr:molybdopterin cofactor-binding domain-containing protein [Gemmatimonadaceae bacterium]